MSSWIITGCRGWIHRLWVLWRQAPGETAFVLLGPSILVALQGWQGLQGVFPLSVSLAFALVAGVFVLVALGLLEARCRRHRLEADITTSPNSLF